MGIYWKERKNDGGKMQEARNKVEEFREVGNGPTTPYPPLGEFVSSLPLRRPLTLSVRSLVHWEKGASSLSLPQTLCLFLTPSNTQTEDTGPTREDRVADSQ